MGVIPVTPLSVIPVLLNNVIPVLDTGIQISKMVHYKISGFQRHALE
ncbi:hypothetical protein [Wolbachia endosymbiont of Ctenocephalides felis wCfeJ]|nr:hypothetical protein [Wolbachia endosymbiont of Ctenocephalides felis wCfeJ]